MGLNAKKDSLKGGGNSDFGTTPPLESGTYPARLVNIIGMGKHVPRKFNEADDEKPPKDFIRLVYEILDEFMLDKEGNEIKDKPRWVGEEIPLNHLSSDLATSTKRYYALDPNEDYDGDWAELVGKACMVTIVQNKSKDKVYENIKNVSTMRAKQANSAPELVNPPRVFDPDGDDAATFKSLPEWMQDRISAGLEFSGSPLEKAIKGLVNVDEEPKKSPKEEPKEDDDNDDEALW